MYILGPYKNAIVLLFLVTLFFLTLDLITATFSLVAHCMCCSGSLVFSSDELLSLLPVYNTITLGFPVLCIVTTCVIGEYPTFH